MRHQRRGERRGPASRPATVVPVVSGHKRFSLAWKWMSQCIVGTDNAFYFGDRRRGAVGAPKEVFVMESIKIPTPADIVRMSVVVCERERTRLRNEVSFARGNALWGGPSANEIIKSCNEAIAAVNERLSEATAHMHDNAEAAGLETSPSWDNAILG